MKKKKRRKTLCVAICLMLMATLLALTAEPANAATTKVVKRVGNTITLNGGQKAISCSYKVAKAGNAVAVKVLARSSTYAKGLYYGKSKGWSNAKIARTLRKGTKFKVQVPKTWTFKRVLLKGKTCYIAYAKAKPVAAEPVAESPKPATQTPQEGTLVISLESTDTSYDTSAYSLKGNTAVVSEGDNNSQGVFLDEQGQGELSLPAGTYNVRIPVRSRFDTPAYNFNTCTIEVDAGETVTAEIEAEPVPCRFYVLCDDDPEEVSLYCEETGKDMTLESKDSFEMSPFEADIPAGDYTVSAGDSHQRIKTAPGWFSVEL